MRSLPLILLFLASNFTVPQVLAGTKGVPLGDDHPLRSSAVNLQLVIDGKDLHCSGTVVSSKFILTAGHCLEKSTSIKISFEANKDAAREVVGKHFFTDQEKDRIKTDYRKNYSDKVFLERRAMDIGLLEFSGGLPEHVGPLSLAGDALPNIGTELTVISAGPPRLGIFMSHKYEVRDSEMFYRRMLFDTDAESVNYAQAVKENILIIGSVDRSSVLSGDSGSPVLLEDRQTHEFKIVGVLTATTLVNDFSALVSPLAGKILLSLSDEKNFDVVNLLNEIKNSGAAGH
ncbi:MAG: trypsin-like serine protease [Deltaproteobacteria bacterium]|nr:trypsin-like serine protease [Deltaproteobacteria bacterium]